MLERPTTVSVAQTGLPFNVRTETIPAAATTPDWLGQNLNPPRSLRTVIPQNGVRIAPAKSRSKSATVVTRCPVPAQQ
jgi:hypothetical protein